MQPTFNYFNIGSTLHCIALHCTDCTATHSHYWRAFQKFDYFNIVSSAPTPLHNFSQIPIFHDRRTFSQLSRPPYTVIFHSFHDRQTLSLHDFPETNTPNTHLSRQKTGWKSIRKKVREVSHNIFFLIYSQKYFYKIFVFLIFFSRSTYTKSFTYFTQSQLHCRDF